MEIKVKSPVMMSDSLRGKVPELEEDVEEQQRTVEELSGVIVITEIVTGSKTTALVGSLRGVLFNDNPEIEFRSALSDALDVVEANDLKVKSIELHHGLRIIRVGGPYLVKASRIDEINFIEEMCTLGLHLQKTT